MPTTGVGLDSRGLGASFGMYSQRYVSVYLQLFMAFVELDLDHFLLFFKESSADH